MLFPFLILSYIFAPLIATLIFKALKISIRWAFLTYILTSIGILYAPAAFIFISDYITNLHPQPNAIYTNTINCGNAQMGLYALHFFVGLPISLLLQNLFNGKLLMKRKPQNKELL